MPSFREAIDSAVAIELTHNALLVLDAVQDGGETRCGSPTSSAEYDLGATVNVGGATNLPVLRHLTADRWALGRNPA